jgi:hypothetical protein
VSISRFVFSAITFCLPVLAGQAPKQWSVFYSQPVDVRIRYQLKELAAGDRVSIQFAPAPAEAKSVSIQAGHLVLELIEKPDLESFWATLEHESARAGVKLTPELAKEGYILEVIYSPDSVLQRMRITAATAAGLHNALLRVPTILSHSRASLPADLLPQPQAVRQTRDAAILADYPSFPIRGVVEGFYGTPWSHQQRLDMLHFLGQHGMNVYYYGPKDDPYHRSRWRDPYPPEEMKRFGELAQAARRDFVDFSFAISPGLSMIYSSDGEFQKLTDKIDSFWRLGISSFALFLDDVPQDLVHQEDKKRFHTLGEAHAYLINRLYRYLKSLSPEARLMVTPTTYTNEWGNRDYVRILGDEVPAEIPIAWTGPEVGSREITVAQAQEWGRYLHRRPVVWDNFPGNDGSPWRLILEPVRGRDAGLASAIVGLFSNPMYQAHAAFIPLQTVAAYLWNPLAYDPVKSRAHALASQYGADAPQLLEPLLKIYGGEERSGSAFGSLFSERRQIIDIPQIESQINALSATINSLATEKRFGALTSEISPIPDMLRERLARLLADPAFQHLPDGKIQWDANFDVLKASQLSSAPTLDGDFSKWSSLPLYLLNSRAQIEDGADLWKGPEQFSARVALGWDSGNLYVGVEVTDSETYQPFFEKGVQNGDVFRLILDTAARGAARHGRATSAYDLYLSPGNFAGVGPSIYCEEDFLPPRPLSHDYNKEIRTAWKRTPAGFSADIVVPISFFEGRSFTAGQEIGLSFGAQKSFPPKSPSEQEEPQQIVFTSKKDPIFHVDPENPVTFQPLVLAGAPGPQ